MKRYLGVLLLSISAAAYGGLNKWVDSEGNVHYSDVPPAPDVKSQVLKPPPSKEPAEKSYVEREAEWKKSLKAKQDAEQKSAKDKEDAEARQKNCEGAKANLKAFESDTLLATYNDKGERIIMDDAARQRGLDEARARISKSCD